MAPAVRGLNTKESMKRIVPLFAIMVPLFVVTTIDAGPIRNLLGRLKAHRQPVQSAQAAELPAVLDVVKEMPAETGEPPVSKARKLDPKSFAGALQKQLLEQGDLDSHEKKLLRILNGPDSPRRERQLARMEGHVRVHLGLEKSPGDWSGIDWPSLLPIILQLLVKLLPLLLGL